MALPSEVLEAIRDAEWWPQDVAAVRPPQRFTVSEWVERHRHLDEQFSARPGRIDLTMTPWVREILDSFGEPKVREITMVCSRQVAKTTSLESMIAYSVAQDPGPAQLTLHSEPEAKKNLQRVRKMVEVSPELRRLIPDSKRAFRDNRLTFDRMFVKLGWATSTSTLKGDPLRYLFNDETDAYDDTKEGHPLDILAPSTNTYWNSKTVNATTPIFSHQRTWRAYDEQSDRCEFFVPCPECGEFQPLEFSKETVRWPEDARDPEVIEDHELASLHCRACSEAFPDRMEKIPFLAQGLWVPYGCEVVDGEVVGKPRSRRHRGFRVNALYAPWLSYSDMAAAFLRLRHTQVREFKNLWEGLPYESKDVTLDTDQLAALEADYDFGDCPEGVQALVAGVDVQHDRAYFVVLGFGEAGASWLIDAGCLHDEPSEKGLTKVLAYLEGYAFEREGGRKITVSFGLVDSGDGHTTEFVYAECRARPRFWPCKGYASRGKRFGITDNDRLKMQKLVSVSTDDYKSTIAAKITEPSSGPPFRIPRDTPADVRGHFTSEIRVIDTKDRASWKARPGYTGRNDYWDCAVYAWCAGEIRSFQYITAKSSSSQQRAARRPSQSGGGRPWVRGTGRRR